MGAMSAWRESRFVRNAPCAISVATRTKRRRALRRSGNLRASAQRVETGSVRGHGCAARQGLDMAHGCNAALVVEEKEGVAGLAVIAPQLRHAVMAHERRLAERGLQAIGRETGDASRLAARRCDNGLLLGSRGRCAGTKRQAEAGKGGVRVHAILSS